MASAGELCSVCYAGTLQLLQGYLVCEICGMQSQVRQSSVRSRYVGGKAVLDLDPGRGGVCSYLESIAQLRPAPQEFVETQEELPEGQAPNTARRIKQRSTRGTIERETIPVASLTGATCTQLVMGYALLWQQMLKVSSLARFQQLQEARPWLLL